MLASRGFKYTTEFEAQHRGRGATEDKFHDHCRCQVVPAWKGREAHVAEILLERDDVQNELSLRQLEVTEANMAAIRARAMQGLYQLALGAESESVRLQALGRLLDVTGGATTKAEQMDLSNTESTQIKEALAAIGRAPVL